MALPLYLALTAAEFQNSPLLPEHFAWMACHYSPYALDLSNTPSQLPENAMLIINDRTPAQGHDPALILRQVTELADTLHYKYMLLDFQQQDSPENNAVVQVLTTGSPCPVGVSDRYAKDLDCPVFVPPAPLHIPITQHLAPWQDREIWLEAALGGEVITVTDKGSHFSPLRSTELPDSAMEDSSLHCHYHIRTYDDHINFTLWRTREDLTNLLREAEALGVTLAVGLWQELQ